MAYLNKRFETTETVALAAQKDLTKQWISWFKQYLPNHFSITEDDDKIIATSEGYTCDIKLTRRTDSTAFCCTASVIHRESGKIGGGSAYSMTKKVDGTGYYLDIPYLLCKDGNDSAIALVHPLHTTSGTIIFIFTEQKETFVCSSMGPSSGMAWNSLSGWPSASNVIPGTSLPSARDGECMMMPSVYQNKVFPTIKNFKCTPSVSSFNDSVVFGGNTYTILHNGICMLKA